MTDASVGLPDGQTHRVVSSDAAPPAVELAGITKRFPGVVANHDVDLRVATGEIHAIVGENGAGKSTLMKILYGMQRPDAGSIKVEGRLVQFRSPRDAIDAGIGMVHQHFMLADNLTVLENIILGSEPKRGLSIDFDTAREKINHLASTYGVDIDPDEMVENLAVGERQLVEVIKLLYRGARLLVLDEPTSALVPHEVDELFENLRHLAAQGKTVIFISHKLDEVLSIADHITVLRAGMTVTTVCPEDVTATQLAELMVGAELPKPETHESTVTDVPELTVDHVGVQEDERWLLQDVSFVAHRGEVVGIAGVEGNGQRELVETIVGLRTPTEGTIRLADTDITGWTTRARREAGIGYIPEDRQRALLLSSPLWENAMLGHQTERPFARGPWIDIPAAKQRTEELLASYGVRAPGTGVAAHALSGGNQQKLVVGREMVAGPKILVASHPTRGVDVGAQGSIWDLLRAARAAGLAVLLLSADLEELIGLSDTLYVILRGHLVARLDPNTVTAQELGAYMTGVKSTERVA